ncbi:MAG TPA: hypothetical protein ENH40_03205, partial [Nitrospirae bacterium]|nr:hypothetical protein [Nitrospirota bacterium]
MRELKLLLMFVFIISLILPLRVFAGDTGMAEETVKNGAEEKSGEVHYLDEVVTTATRIPHLLKYTPSSVTVITRDRIEAANPQDVADVLEDIAGLKIERYGSMGANSTVHIRGLYSSHVLVMVDGRPVNSPSTGSADLSWLSVDNIERIEVVRGPGSALYGANAVAGVINIITKSPPEEFTAKVTTSYGTWDTLITRLENGWKLGDFSYSVTANRKNSNGYRDNSAHESRDISAKLFYEFDKEVNLSLSGGHYHGRTENPGAKPAENFNMRTGSQQL